MSRYRRRTRKPRPRRLATPQIEAFALFESDDAPDSPLPIDASGELAEPPAVEIHQWLGEDRSVTVTAIVLSAIWLAILAGILIPLLRG